MKISRTKILFTVFYILASITSCKKYLSTTPNNALTVPTTLQDYQELLDNNLYEQNGPGLPDVSTDDMSIDYPTWQASSLSVQNAYIWANDIFQGTSNPNWDLPYNSVYYANVALDGLAKLEVSNPTDIAELNRLKGTALFYRAFNFFGLEEVFGQPYVPTTAGTDLGIELRLSSNLSAKLQRASVQQSFAQMIRDLMTSKDLLPAEMNLNYRNRPYKPAVFALLSRIYLVMQDYSAAKQYADSCLSLYNSLVDYNAIDSTAFFPFAYPANAEVIFQSYQYKYDFLFMPTNSSLYYSFDQNDLRLPICFQATTNGYRGYYTGTFYSFDGLAVDEVVLTRAETEARMSDASNALADLNSLLKLRWRNGSFVPVENITADSALAVILGERRKELLFRGIRWTDLRRLNQDPKFAITLKRMLGNTSYDLPPNDPRYAFLIPDDEIELTGIKQNPR